ncbi:receptor-like serine/threonine-protein kinase At2g45590 isoform X6 [Brassica rapa]|uniref:receptor-like serine/threonine-protein kinase At2g45590 isoform X5 n=1 Tax=Brassica campestris TaxID=3711 RepID=UPI00142DDE85|nr:receptor-like serine/threonine-protein kinase At2g45590 isoform X5 [Brassica rapa]XP_033146074.1 receptor-like serine/threonine-protein kinase At2g45590 isoform X6 [Brassica rapa]
MPSPPSPPVHNRFQTLPVILTGSLALTGALLVLLTILLYRKLSRNRTAPSDASPQHYQCRRFSYSQLRRATNSFSDSSQLGHGGFGTVYKADLPNGTSLAVKVMDSSAGALQGEREFHNELSLSSHLTASPHVVSLLGFSSDRRNRRLVLVYELMPNRSLQEALLGALKCEELMDWRKRFEIAIDVAKGIEFLHHRCDPAIIHGDVKPSNVLLDSDFKAKIGDFGLARVKSESLALVSGGGDETRILIEEDDDDGKRKEDDNGSILEECESVITLFEEGNAVSFSPENGCGSSVCTASPGGGLIQSPENCAVSVLTASPGAPLIPSPENGAVSVLTASPGQALIPSPENCAVTSPGGESPEKMSVESGGKQKVGSRRDWWWKQDNNGGSRRVVESGSVKDYVMEWIGSEIKKDNKEWIKNGDGSASSSISKKKKKKRKPREWWKEEFCEELTRKKRKKKKKRGLSSISSIESWFHRDNDDEQSHNPTKRKKRNSIDWWVDGLSGDLKSVKKQSQDSGLWCDVNVQKSGGVSSTPSMRGTVCYIAPECGGGVLSEKCDVYSFGVLLLVLVSGRRPLQVTASPMSEFERANLISWAKQLACHGNLLELVDKSIHSLEKEQAVLCVTIALLCLQRSPVKRPTMKEIVEMLTGASEPPHLPFEFSPSPPMGFPFKSRKKAR